MNLRQMIDDECLMIDELSLGRICQIRDDREKPLKLSILNSITSWCVRFSCLFKA